MNKKIRYTLIVLLVIVLTITIAKVVTANTANKTSTNEVSYASFMVENTEEEIENVLTGRTDPITIIEGEAQSGEYDNEALSSDWWLFCSDYGVELPPHENSSTGYGTSRPIKGTSKQYGESGFASEYKNAPVVDYAEQDLSAEELEALGLYYGKRGTTNSYSPFGYRYYYTRELITENANVTAHVTENAKDDEDYLHGAQNVYPDIPWDVAYVLASTDRESAGTKHYSKEQYALWYALGQEGREGFGQKSEEDSANCIAGEEMAKEAEAFEKYKETFVEPSVEECDYEYKFEDGEFVLGPIIINYAESTDPNYVFSEIDPESCVVTGTTYDGQEVPLEPGTYELRDKNGDVMLDATGITSGEEFYLVLANDDPIYTQIKYISKFELEVKQLDVKAGIFKVDGMQSKITQWTEEAIEKVQCYHVYTELVEQYNPFTGQYTWDTIEGESYQGTHISGDRSSHGNCYDWDHYFCYDEDRNPQADYYFLLKGDETTHDAQELYILRLAEKIWSKYKLTITFEPPAEDDDPPPTEEEEPPQPTYIDLGGRVWVDLPSEDKKNDEDGIYNEGTEHGKQNVLVTLYFSDGITKVQKGKNGEYGVVDPDGKFENDIYTDENGEYMFCDLPMDKQYYVEFTYDGMTYEPTMYLATDGNESAYKADPNNTIYHNNSKVKSEIERDSFNARFKIIFGGGPDSYRNSHTRGFNAEGKELIYLSKNYTINNQKQFGSRLITTDTEKDVEADDRTKQTRVMGKVETEYEIKAKSELVYPFESNFVIWGSSEEFKDQLEYLKHINLGLKRRNKSDLALQTQIKAGAMTIKDKEKVVFYKSNVTDENLKIDGTATQDEYIKQEISAADYYWAEKYEEIYGENKEITGYLVGEDKLKVYVLYRIVLQDQCVVESEYGVINEIVDYYDGRLTMVPSEERARVSELFNEKGLNIPSGAISWVEGTNTQINWSSPERSVNGYQKIVAKDLNLVVGKDKSTSAIYLILKVEDNGSVLNTGTNNETDGIQNIAEISSYSIYSEDGKIAGKVDCDSAPYNATPGNKDTYEDDTDPAPMFRLEIKWNPREISGNVWEDLNQDGILNETTGVQNVTIKLIEYVVGEDGTVKEIERPALILDEANKRVIVDRNKSRKTESDGSYLFYVEGGNYALKFIYGDTYMLIDDPNNPDDTANKKYNGQDYQATNYTPFSSVDKNAYATVEDLLIGLKNKLVTDEIDIINKNDAQSGWETNNWGNDTSNNISTARDVATIRADIIKNTNELTFDNASKLNELNVNGTNSVSSEDVAKYLSGNNNTTTNYTYMESVTDIITISSNDLAQTPKVMNLGLKERPKASIELKKEVMRIVVKTNDGVTLIDTADSSKLTGLQQLGSADHPFDQTFINMDAITMEGATIDIDYEIKVTNKGQADYLQNYVYIQDDESVMDALAGTIGAKFGESTMTRNTELPVRAKTIYDYVNINLEYRTDDNKNAEGNELWTKVYEDGNNALKSIPNGMISVDVESALPRTQRKVSKVLKTSDAAENTNTNLRVGSEALTIPIHLGITLAEDTSGDLGNDAFTYSNCAEIVEIYSGAGRRDYDSVPGNYVPYSEEQEPDQDLTGTTIITPPLGQERIYYVIAIISATIIIAGIVLIKKKVLNK